MTINYSEIENEIKQLVKLTNENKELFLDKESNLVLVPDCLSIVAHNFVKNENLDNIKSYSRFVDSKDYFELNSQGDTIHYKTAKQLSGLTPSVVLDRFTNALNGRSSDFKNLIELATVFNKKLSAQSQESTAGTELEATDVLLYREQSSLIHNHLLKQIEKAEKESSLSNKVKIVDIQEENHSDIVVDSDFEIPEFKKKTVNVLGNDSVREEKINNLLKSSIEKINNGFLEGKKWNPALIFSMYKNAATGWQYNAENSLLLSVEQETRGFKYPHFLTPTQAIKAGYILPKATDKDGKRIPENEQCVILRKFKTDTKYNVRERNSEGLLVDKLDDNGNPVKYKKSCLGLCLVYNIDQLKKSDKATVDFHEKARLEAEEKKNAPPRNEEDIKLITELLTKSFGIKIIEGGNRNYYSVSANEIHIGSEFVDSMRKLHTIFHELMHSTGHKDILNRESLYLYHTDKKYRGSEEFKVNVATVITLETLGLIDEEYRKKYIENNDVYNVGWGQFAKLDDPKELLTAFSEIKAMVNHALSKLKPELQALNVLDKYIKQESTIEQAEEEKTEVAKKQFKKYKNK